MILIKGLSKKNNLPYTILYGKCRGYQYRWYNNHIQVKTPTGRWYRAKSIPVSLLEEKVSNDKIIIDGRICDRKYFEMEFYNEYLAK